MPAPGFNLGFGVGQARKPMFIQTLLSQAYVKALHHGVICGLSRSADIELNAIFVGPPVHRLSHKFAASIRLYDLRPAPLGPVFVVSPQVDRRWVLGEEVGLALGERGVTVVAA
jgi:hypothetical protein